MTRALAAMLRGLIQIYRYALSPLLGPRCRFHPSCSAYALEAIAEHGPFRGALIAARRLGRCHPWGGEGYDPVPRARGLEAPVGNDLRF